MKNLIEFIRAQAHDTILSIHENICSTIGENWHGIDDGTDGKKLPLLEAELRQEVKEAGIKRSFQLELLSLRYQGHSLFGREGRIKVIVYMRRYLEEGGERPDLEWACGRLYGYAEILKKLAGRSKKLITEAEELKSWSFISAAMEY